MLWNASAISQYTIEAIDGPVGTVSDFLFDDSSWSVRWLVVDTGKWLTGRKVILPTAVLGHPDPTTGTFSVRLTLQQVEDSPEIDPERPASRRAETRVYEHYRWNPYWGGGYMSGYIGSYGMTPFPVSGSNDQKFEIAAAERNINSSTLCSVEVVTGYHIEARDGDLGHIEDFLVEDGDWSIHFLVVDTRNWWVGKRVLISPKSVLDIDWQERMVTLDVDRQKVKDSPAYDPSTTVDKAFEQQFHRHYGLPAEDGGPFA
jgi:hypothetical protein